MDKIPDGIVKDLSEPPAGDAYKTSGKREESTQSLQPDKEKVSDWEIFAPAMNKDGPDTFKDWKK